MRTPLPAQRCMTLLQSSFHVQAGQFIGARGDFVPEQICRKLCLLHDRVPPMPADQARAVLCRELGVDDPSEVFEWIDLEDPLGSASVSQVTQLSSTCDVHAFTSPLPSARRHMFDFLNAACLSEFKTQNY